MKQVKHRNSTSKVLGFCLAVMLAFSTSIFAQGDVAEGKSLFNSNCAACHKLDKDMTGPALRGVAERLDKDWLYDWIRNSSKMIKAGDSYAVEVFEKYNKTPMTAFPQFSDADLDNILAYTSAPKPAPKVAVAPVGGQTGSEGVSTDIVLGLLTLVLIVLAAMLFMVTKTLNNLAKQGGVEVEQTDSIWKKFVKNQFLVLVSVIVFMLFAGYHLFGFFMQVGVDQGYKPVQPIHFSHKIHAGDNGIDCKYCHSNARVSKTSGIPALNVCMNCHKNIGEVAETTATADYSKEFYDKEIQKLYKATGWSEADQAYTGTPEPVKWVRVHNLPDFAYYNHSQHVTVGGLACQKCHGPVEEMEILEQHSPLTMGWCINCHRETNVKTEGNEYYTKIHAELKKKYGVDQLTVAQMGGLECGKCHY